MCCGLSDYCGSWPSRPGNNSGDVGLDQNIIVLQVFRHEYNARVSILEVWLAKSMPSEQHPDFRRIVLHASGFIVQTSVLPIVLLVQTLPRDGNDLD